jgi:hypothetical protein
MNAKMSQHLTLLGLCAMAFYGAMLATGTLSIEVMPQFAVSALIFLTSGRLPQQRARVRRDESEAETKERKPEEKPDCPWLTALLHWMAALLITGVLAIFIMKPVGVSFSAALAHASEHAGYFSTAVP